MLQYCMVLSASLELSTALTEVLLHHSRNEQAPVACLCPSFVQLEPGLPAYIKIKGNTNKLNRFM